VKRDVAEPCSAWVLGHKYFSLAWSLVWVHSLFTMNVATETRTAALARWTTSEIVFRLASDELSGVKDAELNRALETLLVSRVGIAAAVEQIEQERETMFEERQEWAAEQMSIASALARGETAEQGREMHRRMVAEGY
jgi:hypothetical protein